jgi:hypothetical protein
MMIRLSLTPPTLGPWMALPGTDEVGPRKFLGIDRLQSALDSNELLHSNDRELLWRHV